MPLRHHKCCLRGNTLKGKPVKPYCIKPRRKGKFRSDRKTSRKKKKTLRNFHSVANFKMLIGDENTEN